MSDDRVLRQLDDIRVALDEVLRYISNTGSEVWELLADACDDDSITGPDLLSTCLAASHISRAFFWFRCLRRVEKLPLSLTVGCIHDNLQSLRGGDEPSDDVSSKIWRLLQGKMVPDSRVVAALALLKDASFTTRIIEQLHAFASVSARFHSEYGMETIRVRSFGSLLLRLLPGKSLDEIAIDKETSHLVGVSNMLSNRHLNVFRYRRGPICSSLCLVSSLCNLRIISGYFVWREGIGWLRW